jgi:HAE1 family hydrophobic/amphiphilic exporter-1
VVKGISEWVLKRKSATILITLLIFFAGLFATTQIKSELLPNISFPIVTVTTVYPGANSNDVADLVTKPVEQTVASIPGLQSVRSTSQDSFSLVVAEFAFGTDLDKVQQELSNKFRQTTLPNGLNGAPVQPSTGTFSFDSQAIVNVVVEGNGKSAEELGKWAREQAIPSIATLPDVGRVLVIGDPVQVMTIKFDPAKLSAKGLTLNSVVQVLQANNVSLPGGSVDVAGQSVPVRTAFTFNTIDDVKNLILPAGASGGFGGVPAGFGGGVPAGAGAPPSGAPTAQTPPTPTRLQDVAEVTIVPVQQSGITRTNGSPGVGIQIYKTQAGNTVKVSDGVKKEIENLRAKFPEIKLGVVYDQADQVRKSIEALLKEGLLGAGFAVLVIFFFLRSVRSTLVTAVSIPTSVVLAMLIMWQQGITLNIMTLGGLAVAVGRVVDDAIVVLENIYRRVQEGDPIPVAVRKGTQEVAGPITSSTITTVAVFLPLGFVGGVSGEFFLPFALTVTFALLASLLVSVTIVPVLAAMFIKRKLDKQGKPVEEKETFTQRVYTPMLKWSLKHRWLTLLIAFSLFVGSIAGAGIVGIPFAFLPSSGDKLANVTITLPPGSDDATVIRTTEQVEQILGKNGNVELYQTTIAGDSEFSRSQRAFGGGGGDATIFVRFKSDANLKEEVKTLRSQFEPIKPQGGKVAIQALEGFSSSSISLVVQGPNPDAVREISAKILEKVSTVPNLANVKSDVSAVISQIQITPDATKAGTGGAANVFAIGSQIRTLLQGQNIGTIRFSNGQNVNVLAVLPGPTGGDIDQLIENIKKVPFAGPLTIGDIAKVEKISGATQVTRIDQQLAATITGDITVEDTAGVSRAALVAAKEVPLPAGVTVSQSGVGQQQAEAFAALGFAMLAAIALVYIIMVITFGSLLVPFTILFSLPLALIGALTALFLTQRALGLPSLIGMLMLIGIVVTNAIVLLDLVQHLRDRGHSIYDALMQGGRTRVRPIIMTAIATILALVPLAAGISGGGTIIAAELGTVVIGGLLSSTFLTLLVIPVIYSLLEGMKERLSGGKGKKGKTEDTEVIEKEPVAPEVESVPVMKIQPSEA